MNFLKRLLNSPPKKKKHYFTFGNMVTTKKIYFTEDLTEIYGTDETHCGEHIDGVVDHKINVANNIAKLAYIWRRMEAFDAGVGSAYIDGKRYTKHPEICNHIEKLILDKLGEMTLKEREQYHGYLAWYRKNRSW